MDIKLKLIKFQVDLELNGEYPVMNQPVKFLKKFKIAYFVVFIYQIEAYKMRIFENLTGWFMCG